MNERAERPSLEERRHDEERAAWRVYQSAGNEVLTLTAYKNRSDVQDSARARVELDSRPLEEQIEDAKKRRDSARAEWKAAEEALESARKPLTPRQSAA